MSLNPFAADAQIRARIENLAAACGPAVNAAVAERLAARRHAIADNLGGVLLAGEARAIAEKFGLASVEELMLLVLPTAQTMASPPISTFYVGAVGLEAGTGNLVFGGNVEFPQTHLGFTLHGEGFVFTRAWSRGTSIAKIAIGEAHPCAHCRQYLSEFASTKNLRLIDPLGHDLTMAQLYPWPFDPAYLGEPGADPLTVQWPGLALDEPHPLAEKLLAAGRRAHTPYGKSPAAVVLTLRDGAAVSGTSIESVAFNPTIGPLQAAIVDLLAHGYRYDDIESAVLGTVRGGAVDYSRSVAELLGAIAPQAKLDILGWIV